MKKNSSVGKSYSGSVPRGLSGYLVVIAEPLRRTNEENKEDLVGQTEAEDSFEARRKLKAAKSK